MSEPPRRQVGDREDHDRRELGRNRGLGQDRHPGARGDEVGDEPDALDLDRDRQRDALRRVPPARSRCAAGCRPAGAPAASPRAPRTAPARGELGARRRSPTRPRRADAPRASRSSLHRLGDDRLRELLVEHLGQQPLGRTLVDAQLDARRPARGGPRRAPGRATGSPVPTMPSWRARPAAPGARRRPPGAAATSRRIAAGVVRARPCRTRSGVAPIGPGRAGCTPSSASSWRICSETFDCTVRSMSAAAVNVPSSSIAISVSRCRRSTADLQMPGRRFGTLGFRS